MTTAAASIDLPTMTPISGSSQVKAVGVRDGHLYVTLHGFKDRGESTYRYAPHPDHPAHAVHFDAIQTAESAGAYLKRHIKDPGYTFQRVA